MKDLNYYMGLPYYMILTRGTADEGWFIKIKELPGCMSEGATPGEAITNIKEAMELWIETSLENGDPIPEPKED